MQSVREGASELRKWSADESVSALLAARREQVLESLENVMNIVDDSDRGRIQVHPISHLAGSKQSAHWLLELKPSLANCDWCAIISVSSDVSRDVIREERMRKLRECGARLVSDLGS
jgi:hypothetical protein